MPTLIETLESREGMVALAPDSNGRTLNYLAYGVFADDVALDAYILSNLLPFYRGLRFDNFKTKALSPELFEVTVNYGTRGGADGGGRGSKPAGTLTFNFDTGEDKIKMTQAFAQTRFPAPGRTVVDYRGAIGIKKDKGTVKAEGIEVPTQAFNFTVSRTFGPEFALSGTLVGLLIAGTFYVNSDQIDVTILGIDLHFAPGELLFKGATGSQKSGGESADDAPTWEGDATLKFAATKNLNDVTLPGSGIEHVTKQGWDYLEIIYEEDVNASTFVPKPIQANVNQVYPRAPLSFLFEV